MLSTRVLLTGLACSLALSACAVVSTAPPLPTTAPVDTPDSLTALRWGTAGAEALADGDPEAAQVWLDRALEVSEASSPLLFLRGVARFELGDFGGAEVDLRAALALEPEDVASWCALSRALFGGGDLDGAVAALEQAVAVDAADPRLRALLGHVQLRAGRWPDAYEAFLDALELEPRTLDAHRGLALLYTEVGDFERAAIAWRVAADLAPGEALLHAGLGNALRDLNRPEEALEAYAEAARLDVGNPVHRANIASTLQQLGRWEEARGHFEAVLAAELPTSEGRAYVIYNYAQLLDWLGDDDGAFGALELALQEFPEFADAEQQLGLMQLDRGRPELARSHLQRALDLGGLTPEGLLHLALLHEAAGARAEAANCAAILRHNAEEHPEVAFRYAQLLVLAEDPELRDTEQAIAVLRSLLSGPLARHGASWSLLGEALIEEGAFEGALAAVEQALKVTPPENPAWQQYQRLRTECLTALVQP
ncbi:MAG: tetratricopeptide repeat protein [Planctomycetota bacterium]